jgi:hypothetical protein
MEMILALHFSAGLIWLALGGWRKVQGWTSPADRAPPFSARPMLNTSEFRLYRALERWRREHAPRLNLSAQVGYGSFLTSETDDWRSIASKHADFVFWGQDGYVQAIIELDGDGHYGNSRTEAAKVRERDRIKNAAALSANIPLIRIPQNSNAQDIHRTLAEVLVTTPQAPTRVRAPDDRVAHKKTGDLR